MLSREFDAAESAASRLIEEIREQKHKTGFTCPHCGHNKAIWNGTFRSPYGGSRVTRQRYLCKQCGKTFNDLTGTPMHRSRNKELWVSYIELMPEGRSLHKCAKILGVRHERLFYWRHKVLVVQDRTKQTFSKAVCRGRILPRHSIVLVLVNFRNPMKPFYCIRCINKPPNFSGILKEGR